MKTFKRILPPLPPISLETIKQMMEDRPWQLEWKNFELSEKEKRLWDHMYEVKTHFTKDFPIWIPKDPGFSKDLFPEARETTFKRIAKDCA